MNQLEHHSLSVVVIVVRYLLVHIQVKWSIPLQKKIRKISSFYCASHFYLGMLLSVVVAVKRLVQYTVIIILFIYST